MTSRASASIAVVSSHGVEPLRTTLRTIRETVEQPPEVVILAAQHYDDVVSYIARHYVRGDVSAIALDAAADEMAHCGLDRAFHLSTGTVLVRVQDDLTFAPGWLEAAVDTLDEHEDIGMLGLVQVPEPRRRGRPPKSRRAPLPVDWVDLRAFVTRRALFREHETGLMGEHCAEGCRYQVRLRDLGFRVAYLPGQVKLADGVPRPAGNGFELGADMPFHPGPDEAMGQINQVYRLGEEILLPCMSCGDNELEVLAAQIEFCERHEVPVGYTYTLRCTTCHELRYEEDLQFRCPES